MKRFKFKLEKLLEIRAYKEQEAKIALGHAIGEVTRIENEMKSIAVKRLEATALRFKPGSSASEMQYADLYILRLDRAVDKLMEDAAKAELKVSEARDIFLEASKEKKILEKLKEKKEKDYKKFVLSEEDKALDEITTQRANLELLKNDKLI
ncbi:MAG: flagellar export protein FliJ [Treponema sp.]|jgi:flagellar FliJ protein|nr:flagellar export protein FliJ [Treponema sp.]